MLKNKSRLIKKCFLVLLMSILGLFFWIPSKNDFLEIQKPFNYIEPISSYFQTQHKNSTKDWHDYGVIKREALRNGPGEQGEPVILNKEEEEQSQKLFKEYNHNVLVTDKIARDRAVPDTRPPNCINLKYLADLPSVSIVIPFHNEILSTLTRTIHSIFNRTPPELLKEVIVVNDHSDKEHTYGPFEEYAQNNFDMKKLKILVMKERSGLILARLAGAKAASSEILVFMDSHNEVNVNWLPPLIEPIAKNYKTCVTPVVDSINNNNYKYKKKRTSRGALDWHFYYRYLPMLPSNASEEEPFQNPVMIGCAFAISSKFFWELGGYDPGLDIWGGEQFELSFKVWLCGGELLTAPCSRVGHLFRPRPFDNAGNHSDYINKNFKRIAETWMDEYKQHVYDLIPERYSNIEVGDYSYVRDLKAKLHCKPFSYFLEVVAPDMLDYYPYIESPPFALGGIRSIVNRDACIDTLGVKMKQAIGLDYCRGNLDSPEYRQNFRLRKHRDIFVESSILNCLSFNQGQILLDKCNFKQNNQYFRYDLDTKQIYCGRKRDQMCIDMDEEKFTINISKCDENKNTQKWNWGFVNETMLRNWANFGKPILDQLELEDFVKK